MRTTAYEHAAQSTREELLTTGEAARLLGVTRQTVVNLTDRGDLPFETSGTHRRIRRSDVELVRADQARLTRDQRRSLWLAAAIAGKVATNPELAVDVAHKNLALMRSRNPRGMTVRWLDRWDDLLHGPLDRVLTTLTSPAPHAREMRQNNPFAGLLTEEERNRALEAFKRAERR